MSHSLWQGDAGQVKCGHGVAAVENAIGKRGPAIALPNFNSAIALRNREENLRKTQAQALDKPAIPAVGLGQPLLGNAVAIKEIKRWMKS